MLNTLTTLVQDSYNDVSERAHGYVRTSIIDYMGVSIAAIDENSYRYILEYVTETGNGQVPLPGTDQKVSSQQAANALGTLGHALDYDDISSIMIGHPSTVLVPVILALGHELESNGKELIDAYIAGYEVIVTISSSVATAQYEKGWHTTSTIGIFGAVTAASRLLSLNSHEINNAFGIAVSLASGIKANFGTLTKPLHAGLAAGNGIFAAKLAKKGYDSSRDAFTSSNSYFEMFAGLKNTQVHSDHGRRFIEDGIIIKPYPSCGYSIRMVDCALKVREMANVKENEFVKIECYITSSTNKVLRFKKPINGLQAKFSLEYCVARALISGNLNMQHFYDKNIAYKTDEMDSLMQKISRKIYKNSDEISYGDEFAEMVAFTQDGKKFHVSVSNPKGSPENPMNEMELNAKFKDCTKNLWDEKKQGRIYNLLTEFHEIKNISLFIDETFTNNNK